MIGVIGGSISGAIVGFVTGIITDIIYYTNIGDMVFIIFSYTIGAVFIFGIPLGVLIGFITATHFNIFRLYSITSLFWAVIILVSVVLGLWFSSIRIMLFSQDIVLYLEIILTSLVAGWASHKYSDYWTIKEKVPAKNLFLTLAGSIFGSLIISSATCFYFTLMEYLQNIPS